MNGEKGPQALPTRAKAALDAHRGEGVTPWGITVATAQPLRAARESSEMIQVKNFLERKQTHDKVQWLLLLVIYDGQLSFLSASCRTTLPQDRSQTEE